MVNYRVGDFLIQIKNAAMARRTEVVVRKTKLLVAVSNVLKEVGYLSEVTVDDNFLKVRLAFHKKEPVLMSLKIISKPGLRQYVDVKTLMARKKSTQLIISTPKGVMSLKKAIKENVGGELIAEFI